MVEPLLSVLTPSRNYGRFIGDCLNSVARLRQHGVCAQHVVADAASTDETVRLLRSHAGVSPLVKWWSRPDGGQSDALNQALSRATGTWVGWLNADEYYLDPGVHRLVKRLSTTRADVVTGECIFVDQRGRTLRLLGTHPPTPTILRTYGCSVASCATFVRRRVLPPEPWDVRFRTAMDWDLWLTLADAGAQFEFLPIAVAAFRIHPDQVTTEPQALLSDEMQAIRRKHGLPTKAATVRARRVSGRVLHMAAKMRSGAYTREISTLRHGRGAELGSPSPRGWIQ